MTETTFPDCVPVLTDGYVTLRAHTEADIDPMVETAADDAMRRWTTVSLDNTREDTAAFVLDRIPRSWNSGEGRWWAIEIDGRYAGNVDIRTPVTSTVAFALHPWARGHGMAARAVRLAVTDAFESGFSQTIRWEALIGNKASLRVAHDTGFVIAPRVFGLLDARGTAADGWFGMLTAHDKPWRRTPWLESTVNGDGLRLRPLAEKDAARIVETCSDEAMRHWLPRMPQPYTEAIALRFVHEAWRSAADGSKQQWSIADPETDEFLGQIALLEMHRLNPGTAEVGYFLHPDAQGRGLSVRALQTLVDHAFDPHGCDKRRLVLYANTDNIGSVKAAENCGFQLFGTQTAADTLGDGSLADLHCYELLRD